MSILGYQENLRSFIKTEFYIRMIRVSGMIGARTFILFLISLVAVDLCVLLDIPILRQLFGFSLLFIVPGLLILHILKLNRLGLTARIVLSIGLSISFLVFFGLLINSLYPLFSYNTPLHTNSLVISLSVILLVLAVVALLRNRTVFFATLSDFQLEAKEKTILILPAFFPVLGIFGMYVMNSTNNNTWVMTLLFLIPAYVIFVAVKHKHIPDRVYPPMIFFISIALVLLMGLRTNHIVGSDVHVEYYIFKATSSLGQWQIFLNSVLDACLSISILPTIYQSFMNMNSEYLFKVLYPFLFSISPLVVYLISKKYIGSFYAFLASFYFMSQVIFLWTAYNPRTNIAVLFFALSIMVLFHDGLSDVCKKLLFMIFAISAVFSHYASAYIFFFVLVLTWVGMWAIPRVISHSGKRALTASPPGRDPQGTENRSAFKSQTATLETSRPWWKSHTTSGSVALFFVIVFAWYSQVVYVAFKSGVHFIYSTLNQLHQFFILESRGHVAKAFGSGYEVLEIPQQISFVFSWLAIVFIATGVLATLARYRHTITVNDEEKSNHPEFLSRKFDMEYFTLSLACCTILTGSTILPYVAKAYTMDRTYFQMMSALSPFFVLGGIMIAKLLRTKWPYLVVLVVLIPYFMVSSGTMAQVFGWPRDITLNSKGLSYDIMFVHEEETYAARWLKSNAEENASIYADYFGTERLISQGEIRSPIYAESLIMEHEPIQNGYLYNRYTAAVEGRLIDRQNHWHDITEYQDSLSTMAKIYTNGGSEVLYR